MTDAEFISYVEAHSETPWKLFLPEQVERLYRLAGIEVKWTSSRGPLSIKSDMTKSILRLIPFSPLCRFYAGVAPDHKNRLFDDILGFSDMELENVHDYIQWLFPLPEPSAYNPWAPIMTKSDILNFKMDPQLRQQTYKAFRRWMAFLTCTTHWCAPTDHNHLRITRAIRFLTLIDQPEEAELLASTASDMMRKHSSEFLETTEAYWKDALKLSPA